MYEQLLCLVRIAVHAVIQWRKGVACLQRAEDFLKQARAAQQYTEAQAFDFISVCPPYEKVSYEELYDLLEGSPLIHSDSIVVVEYAKRLSHAIRDTIGPLHKIRDKRYGRTFVAVYGSTE